MPEPTLPHERPTTTPLGDPARIAHARRLLEQSRGDAINRLAALAAQLVGAPYAQVSVLTDEQVIAGLHGLELTPEERVGPLEASLCTVAVTRGGPLVIADTRADERVADLPPVTSGLVGAYLGVPLTPSGTPVGALCVYGSTSREWTPADLELVRAVADAVAAELELSGLAADAMQTAVRLDLGFAAADIGSFDWNLVTDELHWDDRLRELFGYGEDYVPHIDSFRQRVHPDDLPRVEAAIDEAVRTCGEYNTDYRAVLPDGRVRWFSARGRVLCGRDGRPERMLGAAYDATERRTASDRVARLLETMSSAFLSLDAEWRFTYVNGEAEKLLERPREELLGRVVWDEYPDAVGTVFEQQYRHAVATGEPVSFEEHYGPLDTSFEVRAWPGPDGLSIFFHDITERVAAEQQRNRARERLEVLSVAGSRLSATLDADEVLNVLSELVLPRFGAWLAVAVREDVAAVLREREPGHHAELRVVHVAAHHPADADRVAGLAALAVPRGRGEAWEESTTTAVQLALASGPAAGGDGGAADVVTVPLASRGRVLGALVVGRPSGEPADRALLGDVATRAAIALDNAVLYGAERRAGLALQRLLLPSELPQLPDIETAARYLPGTTGREVGGDFYIAHPLEDGRLVLAMGDVMGHGMPAAARMGQLRAVLTAFALGGDAPHVVLERLSRHVDELVDVRMATVSLLVYDPAARRLTAASAGHPPPLVAPCDRPPTFVDLPPGPPIGVGPATYTSVTLDVPPATTVVLYTDGLIEHRGESLSAGLGRLREALVDIRLPPDAVCDHILRKLGRTNGGEDDVALLVLSHV